MQRPYSDDAIVLFDSRSNNMAIMPSLGKKNGSYELLNMYFCPYRDCIVVVGFP